MKRAAKFANDIRMASNVQQRKQHARFVQDWPVFVKSFRGG